MFTLDIESPSDGRGAPVYRHRVTTGCSVPMVVERRGNEQGRFAICPIVVGEDADDTSDQVLVPELNIVGNRINVIGVDFECVISTILNFDVKDEEYHSPPLSSIYGV